MNQLSATARSTTTDKVTTSQVPREPDRRRAAGSSKRWALGMTLCNLILYAVLTELAGISPAGIFGWL